MYEEAKAFRLICLTSFLHKTMDRQISLNSIATNGLNQQHAYQVGKSCETIVEDLEESLVDKEIAQATFLVINGAFNNTLVTVMEEVLPKWNVDRAISNLINIC